MWRTGLVAPWHVGSSWTRARTRVLCIGRRILNHCATWEVLFFFYFRFFFDVDHFLKVFIEFGYNIASVFLCFGFCGHEACGILASRPGMEPSPPALEGEVLTTGPPGKSVALHSCSPLTSSAFCTHTQLPLPSGDCEPEAREGGTLEAREGGSLAQAQSPSLQGWGWGGLFQEGLLSTPAGCSPPPPPPASLPLWLLHPFCSCRSGLLSWSASSFSLLEMSSHAPALAPP